MGDDSKQTDYMAQHIQEKAKYHHLNGSNILQPSWIRRTVQNSDGLDRILLDYGFNILPYFSIVVWFILLFT